MPEFGDETFGQVYFSHWSDAEKKYQDETEKIVSGYVANMFASLGIRDVLPASVGTFVDSMTSGRSFAWGPILARFGSEMADSVLSQTMGHALKDFNYLMAEKFHDTRIGSQVANILYQRKAIEKEFWGARLLSEGYDLSEAVWNYAASLPYYSIPDLMLYARYHGPPDNTRPIVWEHFDVPPDEYDIWEWSTLQRLTTEQAHTLLRREVWNNTEYFNELAKIGWSPENRPLLSELGWTMPNAMLMVQGFLQQEKPDDEILNIISIADIKPHYSQTYLDAVLTKPASQDLVAYELRKDPSLSNLGQNLRKIGIHPDYWPIYKELAYQIPPVADIITMAVREAFTPTVAARFGQYEDFPPAFGEWAAKKGLSKDWAERYWAAHWSLPSAMQGFEMLHRGIITMDDLNMLLRALDVMPFWRDKLIQMAYRPLTRVDVRRMYREGVLDEAEVYEAYLNLGYADLNAQRMSEFTVKQSLSAQAKFSTGDIIKAYTNRMITHAEALYLLGIIGIRSEDRAFILATADYKRQWAFTEQQISGIRNLYKRRAYDENKTRSELLKLDLPAEQVDVLMKQWWYEIKAEPVRRWTTAQTIGFIKEGLITRERGIYELQQIGYDAEHIEVYLKDIK